MESLNMIILISFLMPGFVVNSLPTVSNPQKSTKIIIITNSTINPIMSTENASNSTITTTPTSSSLPPIENNNNNNNTNNNNHPLEVQWLPLAIFFIVIFALCYWLCCNSKLCCDCPEFNHRSDENGRYGTCRNPAMRKDRFQATCGYPHAPNVDQHQKYCGPNRLHRYKEPNVAIVDDNDKIIEDTYTLTNSYLNTADSKDEMRMFKHDLEEKRRLHQQRTEMINSLSRNRQMSAISESREPAPVYTSRENIFKMWKNQVKEVENDAWSIHAPSLSEESRSKTVENESGSIIRNSLNDSQESVVVNLNNRNSNSVHSINSMVKIASGRNSIVEDLNKNVKLDEQIVVVPYEQIIKEQNKGKE